VAVGVLCTRVCWGRVVPRAWVGRGGISLERVCAVTTLPVLVPVLVSDCIVRCVC
jgi:hypothetical protein